jgi:hypothetical protein
MPLPRHRKRDENGALEAPAQMPPLLGAVSPRESLVEGGLRNR